jgi:hypothetical protein
LSRGEAREFRAEAAEKPVHFVGAINSSSDCVELIADGFEGTGVLRNRSGAAFHQLQVVFETDFSGLGAVAEGVL